MSEDIDTLVRPWCELNGHMVDDERFCISCLQFVLDWEVCGNRSSDGPLDVEYPPAVCTLEPLHEGMHSNGHCSWLYEGKDTG